MWFVYDNYRIVMDDKIFIELQKECFNIVSAILKSQIMLNHNLALSTTNDTVLEDLVVYARTGYFVGPVEYVMNTYSTAGVGLPIRMVAYYNRKPLGYLSGSYDGGKFLIYHWELSCDSDADAELHKNWLQIITSSLEYLAVSLEEYTDGQFKVDTIGFTSPTPLDHQVFREAEFEFTDDIYKGIPAYFVNR